MLILNKATEYRTIQFNLKGELVFDNTFDDDDIS